MLLEMSGKLAPERMKRKLAPERMKRLSPRKNNTVMGVTGDGSKI